MNRIPPRPTRWRRLHHVIDSSQLVSCRKRCSSANLQYKKESEQASSEQHIETYTHTRTKNSHSYTRTSIRKAPALPADAVPLLMLDGGASSLGHNLRGAGLADDSKCPKRLVALLNVTALLLSGGCCKSNGDRAMVCKFISKGDDMKSVRGDRSGDLRRCALGESSLKSKKVLVFPEVYGKGAVSSNPKSALL